MRFSSTCSPCTPPQASGARTDAASDRDIHVRGDDEIAGRLAALDLDETTPRRALELLAELKTLAEEK